MRFLGVVQRFSVPASGPWRHLAHRSTATTPGCPDHAEKPDQAPAQRAEGPALRGARRDLFREPFSDKGRHLGVAAAQAMVTALDVAHGHGARDARQG
jgi:hypothetical protein